MWISDEKYQRLKEMCEYNESELRKLRDRLYEIECAANVYVWQQPLLRSKAVPVSDAIYALCRDLGVSLAWRSGTGDMLVVEKIKKP
jgi:hypothetical protein